MAKKRSVLDFDYSKSLHGEINPKLSDMMKDGLSKIVPIGQQFKEALEPAYAELTRVTGELAKANERAELAEERATAAESKTRTANQIALLISILAIAIPFIQAWYYDSKNQAKDKEVASLSSTVTQLYQRMKILENEVSRAKTKPLPANAPLRNTARTPNSKKS